MAASEAGICNLALSNIRSQNFIETLDDTSQEAIVCAVWFQDTVEALLRRADWSFARKRVALLQTGTPPPEWGYSYGLPSDCITVRAIADGARHRTLDQRIPFAIENDGTGNNRVLLLNETAAVLIYTMRLTNVVTFSPEFVTALSWALAANIARPLDMSADVCAQTLQFAEAFIGRAIASSYNEIKTEGNPDSEFYTGRLA